MVERRTLGEEKTGNCAQCATTFVKTRHDARFCSKHCGQKWHNANFDWTQRKDRARQNQNRKKRYQQNRENELAKQAHWRQEHPVESRAKDRAEYERNKPAHIFRAQRYRQQHPELREKEYKNRRLRYPWQHCLDNAKNRSAKKGFAFDLTREWCQNNWTGHCALTNLPFVLGTQSHFPFTPSIDRIDATQGYLQSNCRFVLFAVNSFKGTGTDEQMLQIAHSLILRQNALPNNP